MPSRALRVLRGLRFRPPGFGDFFVAGFRVWGLGVYGVLFLGILGLEAP